MDRDEEFKRWEIEAKKSLIFDHTSSRLGWEACWALWVKRMGEIIVGFKENFPIRKVKAKNMKIGKVYKFEDKIFEIYGHKEYVEGNDWVYVIEQGEYDMQSAFGIKPDVEVEEYNSQT